MKGIVLDLDSKNKISYQEVPSKSLEGDQIRIQIKAAALNHRDEWCRQGKYPNLTNGVILGSDGSGVITELGADVKGFQIGQEVIINPAMNWGDNQEAQSKDFLIMGTPHDGTLCEEVLVSADRVHAKPNHLNFEEAAALPLAGLTAYRALIYQAKTKPSDKVLISGFGGGVAQFAAQFALGLGAEVYVTTSSPAKLEKAVSMGTKGGFDYRDSLWVDKSNAEVGGFDVIIDGASGDGLNDLIKVTKPGGRIVIYGATQGNPATLEARRIFWNQIKIMGSTMGSDQDFDDMLTFVQKYQIKPIVDSVSPFSEAVEAFDKMRDGKQMGKIILVP
jgi:NADPH:quinone reductase-like Zn-dependent oxidoreductase